MAFVEFQVPSCQRSDRDYAGSPALPVENQVKPALAAFCPFTLGWTRSPFCLYNASRSSSLVSSSCRVAYLRNCGTTTTDRYTPTSLPSLCGIDCRQMRTQSSSRCGPCRGQMWTVSRADVDRVAGRCGPCRGQMCTVSRADVDVSRADVN